MEWSIQEVARAAGTTSRALRHYDEIGLLAPSRVGANGYRYYDEDALARLQRILLLRQVGVGLPAIADALAGPAGNPEAQTAALARHLEWLREERTRLDRQIATVERTIRKREGGEQLMAEEMFDGFDHTQYRVEVEERWGAESYAAGNRWWTSLTRDERDAFQQQHADVAAGYAAARASGASPESDEVQAIVAKHVDWLNLSASVTGGSITAERLVGYGDMYVGDPRFAANYGGQDGAEFVRDAFIHYADNRL